MLIDTHAHINFNAYKNDVDETIKRSLEGGVWMVNVGSQYETGKRAVEIAERYSEGVWAAIGLHPIHLASGIFKTKIDREEIKFRTNEENFDYEKYRELAKSKKVVAIGEIGLDYYYRPKTKVKLEQFKEKQREVFLKQLELAGELNLPVIFHCRAGHDDLISILANLRNTNAIVSALRRSGVVHCFTGNREQAKKYLEMGFYLSFNGIIFKKIEGINFEEIIKNTPLEKILLETDCPYLTPLPMEGRNEPIYVKYVAERIAEIKNINIEEIAEITTQNAKQLFSI